MRFPATGVRSQEDPVTSSRTPALVTLLLASLALATTAYAQARVEENVNVAITGDVVAVDAAARQLTVKSTFDDETGVVYEVDGAATIMRGSSKIALEEVKVGWNVAMNGHRVGDTRRVTYIKVVKAP
jgi:hypothetical protein